MKSDGLTLLSGSPAVTNITVENGTTLPAAVVGNKGRLFYLTQTDGSYSPGLYTSDGSAWVTGDISGVVAGTGLTGGGTSGAVTLNVDTNTIATRAYVDSNSASISTTGDPSFNNVSLLMHFDGANGSTDFADSSATTKTVAVANGTPTLSTAQAKFGTSSLLLTNTGTAPNTSNTIRIPSGGAGGAFDLSTGDFTIEFHMRPAAAQTTRLIAGTANALTGTGGWGIRLDSAGFVLLGNGNGQGSASFTWTANTWYHVAVCRSGAVTRIFVDGTQVGSNLTPVFIAETSGSYVYLGTHSVDSYNPSYGFNGHLDEVRVTKGVARYTSNFTAPSVAYLDQPQLISGITAGAGISVNNTNPSSPTVSMTSLFTPYDICSSVLGKPDAAATVFMLQSARSFTIPTNFTASQAKASTAATASSVFTIYKNGSSIGTFTFAASGSTAAFSGAGASVVAGDLITIVAPGTQDATLANIAFTLAGNLQ